MNEEQHKRLLLMIRELDKIVPPAKESVLLVVEEDNFTEAAFIATQDGYLRFGVEILKAATLTPCEKQEDGSFRLDTELPSLLNPHSSLLFGTFSLVEEMPKSKSEQTPTLSGKWCDTLINYFWVGMFLFFLFSVIIGAGTIIGWLSERLR